MHTYYASTLGQRGLMWNISNPSWPLGDLILHVLPMILMTIIIEVSEMNTTCFLL